MEHEDHRTVIVLSGLENNPMLDPLFSFDAVKARPHLSAHCEEDGSDSQMESLFSSPSVSTLPSADEHEDEEEDREEVNEVSATKQAESKEEKEEETMHEDVGVKVRDFAFPTWDPRHWGATWSKADDKLNTGYDAEVDADEEEEDEDEEYCGKYARALYDFTAEDPREQLSFRQGDRLWLQYRERAGWFVADLELENGGLETGLAPEAYLEIED
ncbi:uncharacterized protein VTP21DRAFT_1912 [Calcarisporiella thermophila]|uniref:uncharacterized protein n=1 Tax=Calcarisporiella thermophila TaxID=911321 RepID=UPI003743436B